MMLNIVTRNQVNELVKKEVLRVNEDVWKEIDRLNNKIMLLEDEIRILKNGN